MNWFAMQYTLSGFYLRNCSNLREIGKYILNDFQKVKTTINVDYDVLLKSKLNTKTTNIVTTAVNYFDASPFFIISDCHQAYDKLLKNI